MLAVVRLINSQGEARQVRWIDGPWLSIDDTVVSIVTGNGKDSVAEIRSVKKDGNVSEQKSVTWTGKIDLCIGDRVTNFAFQFGFPLFLGEKERVLDECFERLELALWASDDWSNRAAEYDRILGEMETSKKIPVIYPKITDTGETYEKIRAEEVAQALGAEIVPSTKETP